MTRPIAIAIAIACAAAGSAFADDITIDPNPFVSTATRAQVREELQQFQHSGVNPWADDYDQLAQVRSEKTRAQVTAEYLESREAADSLGREDSGATYLAQIKVPATVRVASTPVSEQ
jgi:hypothetical protein